MQFLDGRLIVSPSDLTGFLECEHLTQQELAAARGEIARPERDDPMLDMLSRRGLEHEGKHLAGFRAKGLKPVPPGPSNPLGTKALALDAPGILIHATSNTGSIGYSESHGCIRMTEADEAELFSMVPVGTRVAVAQVTPPRPKGSAPIVQTAF